MTNEKKKIIIAGAGFGGVTAALKLAEGLGRLNAEYEILLLDRHHHQLYTPALYEIAAIPSKNAPNSALKSAILIPIADIVAGKPISVLCDELVGLKGREKKLILQKGNELEYEFLILALGSETNYFAIPGLKEHSFPLKTFDDAALLRDKITDLFQKKNELRVVVGGAGASGVELVAEFVNFVCILKKEPNKNHCEVEFTLVEASPEILPGFEPWAIKKTRKRLANLGITVKTKHTIVDVTEDEISFKDRPKESYDILIWTGGVKGPEVLKNCGLSLSDRGSALIDEYLRVRGEENSIFAIGDNSTLTNPKTGTSLVWNVPVAEAEGKLAAENIIRIIKRQTLKKFVPLKKYPFVLAVGKRYAVADLVWLHFAGFSGWAIKHLVEFRYFLSILPFRKAVKTWLKSVKYSTSND